MIKHFPSCIPFNSQSTSVPCNPFAGTQVPISVPHYHSATLRLHLVISSLQPPPPTRSQDPAFCACPASPSRSPLLPSALHVPQSCGPFPFALCDALPPIHSRTHTQSAFCLLSTSILQNLTIKTNPYPANKLKTKAVP